jgi:hypothetical protein
VTSETIPVKLVNGETIYVQATVIGEEDVSFDVLPLLDISQPLEAIATTLMEPIRKVKPKKASIEFGLEIAVESGKLTALWVKGTGTANLKVTLEWET